MNKTKAQDEIGTDEAKDILGATTREAVIRLIERGVIKDARKLNPGKRNSAWIISRSEVMQLQETRLKKKKKRGQSASKPD